MADEELWASLRWTERPVEDILPPDEGLATGWQTAWDHVEKSCTTATHHGIGYTRKAKYPEPLPLYSTRALALRALRTELERRYAEQLLALDREVERLDADNG